MWRDGDDERTSVPPDGKPPASQPAWRQDFPIEVAQDNFVARRDFTKFMVLTSLAFTAGQFWIGAQSMRHRQAETAPPRRIASLATLPVGAALTFTYPGAHDTCILVRTGEREVAAFSQKCTHLSCAVVPDMEQKRLKCPCHEGAFDLASGRPLQGPPRRPLPRITLELRGDDVYATGVEVRTV